MNRYRVVRSATAAPAPRLEPEPGRGAGVVRTGGWGGHLREAVRWSHEPPSKAASNPTATNRPILMNIPRSRTVSLGSDS